MGVVYTCARMSWTPTATADGTQFAGANQYDGYVAAAAPAVARIIEASVNGEAASTAATPLALRRHSTAGTTPTAKTPGKANPSSPANAGVYHQTAATQPTPANATHLVNMSINAYGGEYRWTVGQGTGSEIYVIGGSAGNSEVSISGLANGTPGQISDHFMVEEL